MSRPAKIAVISVLSLAGLLLVAAAAFLVVVQTAWFKNKVRERVVSVAEQASGGRVEIGQFNYDWRALTAEVSPFVLHGSEPPSAPPFFRAGSIRIGLKIISAFERRVDIASLRIEQPQVYVTVAPDGSTNVPQPKIRRTNRTPIEQLLDLKVQHFELHDGLADYNSSRIPLEMQGENLQASLVYDATGPRYVGGLSSRRLRISGPQFTGPLVFDLDSKIGLESNSIQVLDTTLADAGWKIQLKGRIEDLSSPEASLEVKAAAPVAALKKAFSLPVEPRGAVSFEGQGSIQSSPFHYQLNGKLVARALGVVYNNVAIRNIRVASRVDLTPEKLRLPDVDLAALGGRFQGSVELIDFKKLVLAGTARDFSLSRLAELNGQPTGELNGVLSGPVHLTGILTRSALTDAIAGGKFDIVPGAGGVGVQGSVAVDYDQRAGKIQFGESQVSIGSTHAAVAGVLGQSLQLHVVSKDLNDARPLFPLFGETAPEQLPVALDGGQASFDGTVSGPLADPRISGKAALDGFVLGQRKFDRVAASFDLDRSSITFGSLTVEQGKMRVEGQGRVSLRDWKPGDASTISALLAVSGADLHNLAEQYATQLTGATQLPVSGSLSGTVHVSGSFESPLASADLAADNVTAYGEHFDSIRGNVTFSASALEVSNSLIRSGPARITVSGAYNHPANDWKDGSLRFDLSAARLSLSQIKHVQDLRPDLGGDVDLKASGAAKMVKGVIDLTSLNGQLSLRNATVDGHPYGNLELTASTRLPMLALKASVNLGSIPIQASGEWRMEGDYSGQARVQIPRVPFSTLHDLVPGPHLRQELPFEGFLQGEATVAGALNHPTAMQADIVLSDVQISARQAPATRGGAAAPDLVLRNSQPVRLEATTSAIEIRSASFTAKDTSLTASGRLALDSKTPWDLGVQGRINLTILQIFNPNLLAAGASVVNLTVRGPLTEPQVDGRLELQNASLFLKDFPNGVDQANGLILFDRNRATVQTLTAVTGGGSVTFESGSFVGFRGPALVYRVQASARNVRYRSQDGISITVNAALALVGTSENSVLSGSVTVNRAAVSPRTDIGAMLAATAKPVSAQAEPNAYLRGLQFDVRVESAGGLEVETTLTRNIQADVSLRLRGTPERPVIVGSISVNSGQIEFFGNKYSINRGEINFYNAARIEPVIDMDLETEVRGITVDITFSGSLNKLNFSYRSDPPLEANEIIALLAVGRTPSGTSPLAAAQNTTNTSYLATGSNALLGQAIAPVSGRLEKFFGVGRIKIDPQLTDVTTIPQARLTFEQQVSSDITLTYITNLAVTNQQIVRLEWDLNRRWSVVALRDENGAFTVDFQYKKRIK
ncbi:MAG TPA: translocation/assembly module TamB domain-containing protein [Bryobacteraceae bacterium]|nr:translocation/assembly module TamB domain-containing protein [Bryobacteraceae bacterium]